MKLFSKISNQSILVGLLLLAALFVRFYNFDKRVNFGPEQAISLSYAGELLKRPSLLGQITFRTTSTNQILFHGPQFSYSLIPLIKLFNFDPLPITAYFTLLNFFTGLLLFIWVKKEFNFPLAFFASLLFLFNAQMIHRSLNLWILDYWPLFGLLQIICLLNLFRHHQPALNSFWLGFVASLAIAFDYLALPTFLLTLILALLFSKRRPSSLAWFTLGAVLGNAPMILFDLRHQFFLSKNLWQFFLDFLKRQTPGNLALYHFFQFWPLLALLGGWLLEKLWSRLPLLVLLTVALYLFFNLRPPAISYTTPVGMAPGMTLSTWEDIAATIAADHPTNFNLVTLLDFDTQSHPLRYLLTYRYQFTPEPVTNYTALNALYVFGEKDYDLPRPRVWELTSYQPYRIFPLKTYPPNYVLWKLVK